MLKGQKYPAGSSYAIPTDYSVVAAATPSTRKSTDGLALINSTLNIGNGIGNSLRSTTVADDRAYLLHSLEQEIWALMEWADDQIGLVNQCTGITPDQEATLRAMFVLFIDVYGDKACEVKSSDSPLNFVRYTYKVHQLCCLEIQQYLRDQQIQGLYFHPLYFHH